MGKTSPHIYGRKTRQLNRRLNDQLEREVEVIDRGQAAAIHGHYWRLAYWRIKLADWEAINFAQMEVFILGLMIAALARSCRVLPDASPGDIFAVFSYVLMFIQGLDTVPMLVQQLGRLADIGRRLQEDSPIEPSALIR